MIKVKELSKSYGKKEILKGISTEIPTGQCLAILGPNGAGKSTFLKTLALILKPSKGEILIDGQIVNKDISNLKMKIGLISHSSFLYPELTAYENLEFYGQLYNVEGLDDKILNSLKKVGLKLVFNDPVYTFSRGMLQRLAIARALIHNPEIILLDEPFTGLDQQGITILEEVIKELKSQGKTIIMVTHSFEQAMDNVDRVIIINKGKIVGDYMKQEIKANNLKEIYLAKVAS